jgi:hypothetical protein
MQPAVRDAAFFKLESGETCTSQLLHALFELDQQIVALAYRLDSIAATGLDTRNRFDSLSTHYWAQPGPKHPAVGYRQRIIDALHGVRDAAGQKRLRTCGPIGLPGLDEASCQRAIGNMKARALDHLQAQIDATLCSIVKDIRELRRAAATVAISPRPRSGAASSTWT